jgi:predicted RNase H-like HicB family nuclease
MMNISIKLINNGTEFIANCPELDINCYGADKNEAMQRIKKVIAFYIESAKELGLDINPLRNISIDGFDNFYSSELQNNTNDTIN